MLLALMLGCSPQLDLIVPEDPLSGEVEISAQGNFDQIVLMIDGKEIGGDAGPTATATWDTTTVVDGTHEVRGLGFIGSKDPVQTAIDVEVNQVEGDSIAPQISFQSPGEGQLVGGDIVNIYLQITDNVGLDEVGVWADGDILAYLPTEPPWELVWENVAVGPHTLEAVAVDLAGNEASDTVSFEVSEESDEVECSITNPADGREVSGVVSITVAASASGGIGSVDFFADGELIGNDVAAGWSLDWDSSDWIDQEVALSVDVYSSGGGLCTDAVTVSVVEDSGGGTSPEAFEVIITDPTDGSTLDRVGESVPLKAAVGGGEGAESATLYVNGEPGDTLTGGWQWTWDATPFYGQDVSLEVVAVERVTGAEASDAITVTVPAE